MTLNIGRAIPKLRRLLDQTLPDTATNARTGQTLKCRVDGTGRTRTVPGLPNFVEIPVWGLTFSDDENIAVGDELTVLEADGGSTTVYTPLVVWNHDSYSVSTDADAIALSLGAYGNLPMPPNEQITLTQRRTGLAILADAYIFPLDHDLQATTQDYRLQAVVGAKLTFPNGAPLGANDLISAPLFLGLTPNGTPVQGVISKPRRTAGSMPLLTFYLREGP